MLPLSALFKFWFISALLYKWTSFPLPSLITFFSCLSFDFTGHFPRKNLKQTVGSWTSSQVRGLLSNSILQKAQAPPPLLISVPWPAFPPLMSVCLCAWFCLSLFLSLSFLCEVLPGYWIYKSVNVTLPWVYWSCLPAHPSECNVCECVLACAHATCLVTVYWVSPPSIFTV